MFSYGVSSKLILFFSHMSSFSMKIFAKGINWIISEKSLKHNIDIQIRNNKRIEFVTWDHKTNSSQ